MHVSLTKRDMLCSKPINTPMNPHVHLDEVDRAMSRRSPFTLLICDQGGGS